MLLDNVKRGRPLVFQPRYFVAFRDVTHLDCICDDLETACRLQSFFRDADDCLRLASPHMPSAGVSNMSPPPQDWSGLFVGLLAQFTTRYRQEREGAARSPLGWFDPRSRAVAQDAVRSCTEFLSYLEGLPADFAPEPYVEPMSGQLVQPPQYYMRWQGSPLCFEYQSEAHFYHFLMTQYAFYCHRVASVLTSLDPQSDEVMKLRLRLYEIASLV